MTDIRFFYIPTMSSSNEIEVPKYTSFTCELSVINPKGRFTLLIPEKIIFFTSCFVKGYIDSKLAFFFKVTSTTRLNNKSGTFTIIKGVSLAGAMMQSMCKPEVVESPTGSSFFSKHCVPHHVVTSLILPDASMDLRLFSGDSDWSALYKFFAMTSFKLPYVSFDGKLECVDNPTGDGIDLSTESCITECCEIADISKIVTNFYQKFSTSDEYYSAVSCNDLVYDGIIQDYYSDTIYDTKYYNFLAFKMKTTAKSNYFHLLSTTIGDFKYVPLNSKLIFANNEVGSAIGVCYNISSKGIFTKITSKK